MKLKPGYISASVAIVRLRIVLLPVSYAKYKIFFISRSTFQMASGNKNQEYEFIP
jgi:hypothetical protein